MRPKVESPSRLPIAAAAVRDRADRIDTLTTIAVALLVVAAMIVGALIDHGTARLALPFPPFQAAWRPHLGPGSAPAVLLGLAAVLLAPRWAMRLRWRMLLAVAYVAGLAWIFCLALIDGYHVGFAGRLTINGEYLLNLPRITGVHSFLAGFASHIVDFRPGSWTTHVSGHPPLATLLFCVLSRIGLGGGGAAALVVVVVGASTPVAVSVTLKALGEAAAARRALPLLVFAPAAVWVGVSADGLFAAVAAWSVATMALATRRRGIGAGSLGLASGLLFGATVYLSYGLFLIGLLVAAAAWLGFRRSGRIPVFPSVAFVVGLAAVVTWFTANGFNWWQGLQLLRIRYAQGIAPARPQSYFVWADLACLVVATGPVAVVGLVRLGRVLSRRTARKTLNRAVFVFPAVAAIAVLVADVSGLSKGETERIWLPFAFWLIASAAVIPARRRRQLLATGVVLALLVNHLLLTLW